MSLLAMIFPVAIILFLVWVISEYANAVDVPEAKLRPVSGDPKRWTRRDSLLCLFITAAYAVTAFCGLGNTDGVQSCHVFSGGDSVTVRFDAPVSLGAVRYYSGIRTGDYTLLISRNGRDYFTAAKLPQPYSKVLRWNDGEMSDLDRTEIRSIRVTASAPMYLGELALYDAEGTLLQPDSTDAPALFDEQTLIPAEYSFRNGAYFDEIYHARTALEHIEGVQPYEITHPPLGKLILSLGIRLFGMVPFGWRFSGTLVGVLMLPAMYLFLKKMFGGALTPACCTAVFATDFMHFVQTRIATIDVYAVFFTILMYLFFWLYWQSDRTRRRCWLPPLALSGVCFGLGAASKWTCVYAGGGLAVLWLLDRIFRYPAEKTAESRRGYWRETIENVLWCLLFFVLIPAAVYYVSYTPYGKANGLSGLSMYFSGDYLRTVLQNQRYMFKYHSGVTATHPYSSVWWQWVLDLRPILYYLKQLPDGRHVSFGAWVNPLLCWGGLAAMLLTVWRAAAKRDRTALFILVGYLAQLLPWVFVSRVVFEYHYFPCTVFLLLALGSLFRTVELRHPRPRPVLYSFVGVSLGLFVLFYPALAGLPVSSAYGTRLLRWFGSWPF